MDRLPHTGIAVIRSGRSPHVVMLAIGMIVVGVYGLLFHPVSRTVGEVLSTEQSNLFSVVAIAGSILVLLGVYWPRLLLGLLLERVGQLMSAGAWAVYIATLLDTSTWDRAGLILTISTSLLLAAIWRTCYITRTALPVVRDWLKACG